MGLGLGFKSLENGSLSLKLQGLSSDEAGATSGKVSLTEALKLGRELLVPLKQSNTFLAELLQPVEAGLNGSKIIQAGPEFGFLAAFKMAAGESGGLAALLAPAVQQAREKARAAERMKRMNNLKQMGLAFFNYREREGARTGTFPAAAITSKDGKPLLSWRVAILPYIGEEALYAQFKLDEAWDSSHNKALIERIPASYVCPGSELETGMTTYRLVVTGKSAYKDGKPLDKAALASLGPAGQVPLVVELGDDHAVTRTDPRPFKSPGKLSGHHGERGAGVLYIDGSTRSIAGGDSERVAPADPNDDGSKDQAKFQGAWTVTAASANGKAVPSMVNKGFTFQNNRLLQQVRAGQQPLQSTFLINIKANPRTFDWVQADNKKLLGLYQFRGNSLLVTVALPGQPRPKALNAKGASVLQLALKRSTAAGTARRPNAPGNAAATKGARKNAAPPANSPGAKLVGSSKELFETVNNRELVATTSQGQRISIQLNPDGTTRDGEGNESPTYEIKGLALSWVTGDRIITVNFQSGKPKIGDNCTVQHKKKSDGSPITGTFQQLKIAEINPAKPKRKPSSAIDGTWKIVSATVSGKPSDSLKGRILSFAEGKAAVNVTKPAAVEYRFTYEADTKAKPTEFRVYNGERLLWSGIYRYQGKLLQLCFVRGEKTEPPENFTARGIGHQLYVLEPVKTP